MDQPRLLESAVQPEFTPSIQTYVKEYLDIAARYKWLIIAITIVCTGIGGAVAWFQKDLYRSSTSILVEQQRVPEKYVSSVVGGSVASRLTSITEQVLSHTNLVRVIEELNLRSATSDSGSLEGLISSMRAEIAVETKGQKNNVEAFTISFAHGDPVVAQAVTAKLASEFIEENLKLREDFVAGAGDFLEYELDRARKALEEKEKYLSEFKIKFSGELPSQLDVNLRALDRFQAEKTSLQDSIDKSNERLTKIQRSIYEYETTGSLPEDSEIASVIGGATKDGTIGHLVAQLKKLESQLVSLNSEYTESYPDVILTKQEVEQLKVQIADLMALGGSEEEVSDPYLRALNKEKVDVKEKHDDFKKELSRVQKKMRQIEGQVDRTAIREQEILTLERDYANMQQNYQDLLEKRLNARISENLEKRQKAERFRILDPANLPSVPEGLPRLLLVFGGMAVGCSLGYGAAFAIELWNPTFRRSEDAELSLGIPILATIPTFQLAYGKALPSIAHNVSGDSVGKSQRNGGYVSHGSVKTGNSRLKGTKNLKSQINGQWNLVTKWRPQSIVAEQYRVAATRLVLLNEGADSTIVLTTSAMKGEGKTSTISNLGYTLARDLEKTTLLVDCDFKRPQLHAAMQVPAEPGLADVLYDNEPLGHCINQIPNLPLWVLPIGDTLENPISLRKLEQLSALFISLKARFEYILVDGPPVLPLADTNVLCKFADLILLIVRSGITPRDVVAKAREMLNPTIPTRTILTDAWSQGMPYYVRQGYNLSYAIEERE